MNRINPKCNTKEEYKLLKAYMDEHGTEVVMKETQETSGISYDKIAYIPMAVFLFIGKNLKLPFSAVFALGKSRSLHWDVSCGQEKHFSSQRSIIIQLL